MSKHLNEIGQTIDLLLSKDNDALLVGFISEPSEPALPNF